jgi:hypothetical protein
MRKGEITTACGEKVFSSRLAFRSSTSILTHCCQRERNKRADHQTHHGQFFSITNYRNALTLFDLAITMPSMELCPLISPAPGR